MDDPFKKYLVFDFECTVRCPVGSTKANPHWPSNHVVVTSARRGIYTDAEARSIFSTDNKEHGHHCTQAVNDSQILVGHNLGFDVQWLKKITDNEIDLSGKTLWDTAIAEYILTGQENKFPSLDDLSIKYGLPTKDPRPKAMWDAGLDTTDIPQSIIVPYCQRDVLNTEHIFLKQLIEAKSSDTLKLILAMNDALLAITDMMYNGMKVDVPKLKAYTTNYERVVAALELDFQNAVIRDYGVDLSLSSPKDLSALLYGGELTIESKEAIGTYASGLKIGTTRYKTVKTIKKFRGEVNKVDRDFLSIPTTTHGYSTADEWLEKLAIKYPTNTYISILQKHREYSKQLNNYFHGTNKLLLPEDYIHHNINVTATTTGRSSSSEPNLQNVTSGEKSDIKECYISRFGKDGYIVELDFEQLEMCALAQLSGDEQLIEDITNGVDIHTELYVHLFKKVPTDEQRRQFKRASFALIYGAGPMKIAKTTGVTVQVAKAFISSWGMRYPKTLDFWMKTRIVAKKKRVPSDKKDAETGKPLGIAKYQQPTGRILTFTESLPPWLSTPQFSPNEIMNYPIQSLATGDIIPLFLGKLWRDMNTSPSRELFCVGGVKRALLVNTVHDSVVLDCHKEQLEPLLQVLKNVVRVLPQHIKSELGVEMVVPLRTKMSYGPNWHDQKKV